MSCDMPGVARNVRMRETKYELLSDDVGLQVDMVQDEAGYCQYRMTLL